MQTTKTNQPLHPAWIVLLGMVCVLGTVRGGIINGLGQFIWPAAKDLGVSLGTMSLYYVVSSVFSLLMLPLLGKLLQKYNIKALMLAAACFFAIGCGGLVLVNNVLQWYCLAVPNSLGSAILSTLAGPILINAWFKKKNGLAMGVMMSASFGIGAIIQPIVGTSIATNGWRPTLVALALFMLVVVCLAVLLFIKPVPAKLGVKAYGEEDTPEDAHGASTAVLPEGIRFAIARKSAAFFSMFAMMFLLTCAASFGPHVTPFVRSFGYDAVFGGQVNSAWLIGLCIGAFSFGMLSDKFGVRFSVTLALSAGVIGSLIMGFFSASPTMIIVGVLIFAFFGASVSTLSPLLVKEVFGQKDYVPVFAGVSMGMSLGGLVAIGGFGMLYDALGSYIPIMFVLCALSAATSICVVIAYASKKKMVAAGHWNTTR